MFRGDSERYRSENVKKKISIFRFIIWWCFEWYNDWLAEKNGENDEIGDNLDEMCGEEEEIDSNPSEECLEEKQQSDEPGDNDRQQRYGPRKQLTRNQNVHDIDSLLDENNYKKSVYMNKDGVLEEFSGYLGPKEDKNTKKIWWSSEYLVATSRKRKFDTISDRTSWLASNSRANNIENISNVLSIYTLIMISWAKCLTAQPLR